MGLVLLILLLALLLGGLGFAAHVFWIFAVIVAIAWLAGFAFRSGEGSRWYNR
jgi:Na+/H+ antiporter NhaC